MKEFLCVVVLVMPGGTAQIKSTLVETCPEQSTVQGYFNAKKQTGHIKDWFGMCVQTRPAREDPEQTQIFIK